MDGHTTFSLEETNLTSVTKVSIVERSSRPSAFASNIFKVELKDEQVTSDFTKDYVYSSYLKEGLIFNDEKSLKEWLPEIEKLALKAKFLIDDERENIYIVKEVIKGVRCFDLLKNDLARSISAHEESMISHFDIEDKDDSDNSSSEDVSSMYPNVSLLSLFNLLKIYPVFHESKCIVKHYIDADSHCVGVVLGDIKNSVNMLFKDNGEVLFRHVDKTSGRIRISGTAFFGKDKNEKDIRKIKKLFSFIYSFEKRI